MIINPSLAIAGLPGSGKTRLSLEISRQLPDTYFYASASQIIKDVATELGGQIATDDRYGNMGVFKRFSSLKGSRSWMSEWCKKVSDTQQTSVIFDGLRVSEDAQSFRKFGWPIVYISEPDPLTVLERLRSRSREEDESIVQSSDVVDMWQNEVERFPLVDQLKTTADIILDMCNINDESQYGQYVHDVIFPKLGIRIR